MIADRIFTNGTFVSLDDKDRVYGAAAVRDGKIVALGSDEAIERTAGINTKRFDLEGNTVLPGFIDSHQHMISTGFHLRNVDCRVSSIAELVAKIKRRAEAVDADDWVIGWGYDESRFAEGRHPTAADFKDVSRPVFVTHYSLHSAVANELALKKAGITPETTVAHGEVEKDGRGRLTGRLSEDALELIKKQMRFTVSEMKEAIAAANAFYVRHGVTSVHEAGIGFYTGNFDEMRAFQETSENGSRDVRVYGMILDDFYQEGDLLLGFRNERFKTGAVKMFADGTVSGKTAALSMPYADGGTGEFMHGVGEIERKIMRAHRAGVQVAVHAIGDAAVSQVLTAYEKAIRAFPRGDCRHRIEHASIITPALRDRMQKLGVIPVPQPGLVHFAGEVHMDHVPEPLSKGVFALHSFVEAGLLPAGSSDSPITPCDPLLGVYTAVTRRTALGNTILPEQKLSLREALCMYTRNAARASFDEDLKGTLEIGKLADFTVVSPGFMSFDEEQLKTAEVEMTIIGGIVVYRKGEE
ncbi:MAG TPA: amidohydrolase [Bacillales bacterium]|nr:amidohydrolase [Bacillales bacterium]